MADQKMMQQKVWAHYRAHRRVFPWRERPFVDDPYAIVVSEIMLQQTQAPRVVPKFLAFMKRFPDFRSLAQAPLHDVLAEWQGLGYNRRALYLKRIAEAIQKTALPKNKASLVALPGIGPHTAGSILAFAFNIPEPFIETNIRSVFIHFFFSKPVSKKKPKIADAEILKLVAATLDPKSHARGHRNPREWFYALMDYGNMLKKRPSESDPARRSALYKKQSPFKGSNRELRAAILRHIAGARTIDRTGIVTFFTKLKNKDGRQAWNAPAISKNLLALEREGFIEKIPTNTKNPTKQTRYRICA